MLDVHIDDFYKDCATTLLSGFRAFPRQQTLFIEDISGPDTVDEFGLHSPRHLAALGAVQWLREEGFIRFGAINRQDSVDDFVLTSKAFTRLIAPALPQSLRGSADNIEHSGDVTPVFQVLEFARLQGDSLWVGELVRDYLLSHQA
ncbi:hypothetical protein HUF18_13800 [Thalassolituus sp. ST750PaO-4]|uniref:hypothetical protein n=1 Tax=Thalassolituus sp. ST750PaO-4 TaxID=2742965 RepID=UPI001CE33989|nr:hypothetical protein [Thalassolituus sp. ST750PaO-4]MCA6060860.1 hypothetical protein [Thalassolituus sp. ST750PaO-4]